MLLSPALCAAALQQPSLATRALSAAVRLTITATDTAPFWLKLGAVPFLTDIALPIMFGFSRDEVYRAAASATQQEELAVAVALAHQLLVAFVLRPPPSTIAAVVTALRNYLP